MKKKILAMMLAAACIGTGTLNCATTVNAAEQDTAFIMGDVNDDGVFSVSDVVLLQKWLLAVPDTHLENWRAANFCDDDRLDVFDLTLMKRAMIYGESGQPISPTTQPIGLNHTEEVIELLKNYDLNDYNEAYRKSLQKMFDRFNEDGYFYHFADSENEENKITLNEDQTNAAIWLMPYANLEDSGILYHVAYQGKYYQVYYYFTDPAYTVSDLWEYMAQRLRIKNINIVDEKFGIVDNSNDEQTDMSAYFAVDDTHYCKIRTFEPEDALMDFLQVLSYVKLDIADNTSTDPITPVNVQPISYKKMDAAIDAINNNDVSSYPDAEREDYRKMFECFSEDGYIYHFTDAENAITLRDDHPNAAIWLMPYANYEDTGILYHVAYQGKYYQVCYYFTDSAYAASDLWEYLEQRLDIKNINVVDEKYGIVDNSNDEQTDISAYFAIDDTHYCKIRTYETEDVLMDFLQVLNFEKLDIADNTSTAPVTPMTAQPIGYKDMGAMIEAIKNSDVSTYSDAYCDDYRKMFECFSEDGFIYQFSDAENAITLREDHSNAAVWLMPYANYEDTGVLYHVAYQGKYYQVYYYFNDPAYTVSDLWEYIEQRLGIKNFNVVDEKYGIVDNSNGEQSVVSAFFAVDDTHYCKVRTYEPEDALTDFLQVLSSEKTVF
ncbi:dockerin type I repeat-containing protein [Ruminococcus flavefaciens]|uniref:dockerin type I repeat-containing protein n=1 Tax=Ruminococcus flavefaciens TaxID=1265 RepID=UPI0026EF9AE2|nr:dockerin type I repeat-containing protein [Ruminococcus flavefaciens]